MLFTYQKRISFGLCLLFIYYYALPLFESYELGQSRFNHPIHHATFHINYLPLYIVTIYQQSIQAIQITPIQYNSYSIFMSLIISFFLCCEILFYLRWKYLENYINSKVTIFQTKPQITNERRDHLLKMAAKYATLHEHGISDWVSLWFKGHEFKNICYDNVMQYLDWCFFLNYYEANQKTPKEENWRLSFKRFAIKSIENMTNHKLTKGYNSQVTFVHNTDDNIPISTTYRPFIFYFCLLIGQCITDLIFIYILRFQYQYVHGVKVWFKIQSNSTSKQSKPIAVFHGLGVHYMPYIPLIYKMLCKSSQHDIFCIEIPWIAMSIWHFIPQSIWKRFSSNPSPSYIDSKLPLNKQQFVEILMHMEDIIFATGLRIFANVY